jgi:hypothetical protein
MISAKVAAGNDRPLPITFERRSRRRGGGSKALIAANASVEFTKGKKPGVIAWLLSKDALEPREPEKIVQSPFGTSRLDALLVLGCCALVAKSDFFRALVCRHVRRGTCDAYHLRGRSALNLVGFLADRLGRS